MLRRRVGISIQSYYDAASEISSFQQQKGETYKEAGKSHTYKEKK